jgi:hydroxymethylglutaryl-CoA lyase
MVMGTALNNTVQLIECPRDAMQGWKTFIPTADKIKYINSLLEVGFDTIDFGSFVSPKAIPQMVDTKEVISALNSTTTKSKLLAIVANVRGAEEAMKFNAIRYLGFPFSISPTFQLRNANSSIEESVRRVEDIYSLCVKGGKELVVYLSMGFGNPYGDPYNSETLIKWAGEMTKIGVRILSLADTVGLATPEQISFALETLIPLYPQTLFGVHLHSTPSNWRDKTEAALSGGCRRFDGALKGIGGCPMAGNDLVGNMDTEKIISLLEEKEMLDGLNRPALARSLELATKIFR